jgi:hypothetical protein
VNPARTSLLLYLLIGVIAFFVFEKGMDQLLDYGLLPSLFKPAKTLVSLAGALISFILPLLVSSEAMRHLGLDQLRLTSYAVDRGFESAIINGSKRRDGSWPVAFRKLRFHRFNIEDDTQLEQLADAINKPAPHPGLYEIELLERRLKISPCSPDVVPKTAREMVPDFLQPAIFKHDRATYHISALFSGSNPDARKAGLDMWKLRYSSTAGFIVVSPQPTDNRWDAEYKPQYEREHHSYEYHFYPERLKRYSLSLTAYNAFAESEQKCHIHLRSDTYYKKIRHVLDLSDLLTDGWKIKSPVQVIFVQERLPLLHSREGALMGLDCNCADPNRDDSTQLRVAISPVELSPGIYVWEVHGIRDGGIISFEWFFEK